MGELDSVFKENIEHIFAYFQKLLGITVQEVRELKDKVHTTIVRETDFLKKVIDTKGNAFILHPEFQSANDSNMVYRMAEYKALLQRKHDMPVHQFVIYLGNSTPTMKATLPEDRQITGFRLINIRDFPTDTALDSDIPEEIILAILADYDRADAGKVIKQIIGKLQKVARDQTGLRRAIQQLLILSRLRNLDEAVEKELKDMPITFDISKDRLYNRGMQRGIERGIERGMQQGEQRSDRAFVLRLRNKGKSLEEIADLTGFSVRKIQNILSSENTD